VSTKSQEPLVDELLTKIGIRTARSVRPQVSEDLWSLFPWRHPQDTWDAIFGDQTGALVRADVLKPIELAAIEDRRSPGIGRVLEPVRLGRGDYQGVSNTPEVPSRALSTTEVEGLQLTPEAFRQYLCSRLGIEGNAQAATMESELLDLGTTELGDRRLHLAYALREPSSAAISAFCSSAADHCVLIPGGRSPVVGVSNLLLARALPDKRDVIRDAVVACNLAAHVPARFTARDGDRLVVDRVRGEVWLDDVHIKGLTSGSHPFTFVEMLATASPRVVSNEELKKRLSQGRPDETTVVRQAKFNAKRSIDQAIKQAGRTPPSDIFPSGGGGYRVAVPCHVV
jgi:hypothetical protein